MLSPLVMDASGRLRPPTGTGPYPATRKNGYAAAPKIRAAQPAALRARLARSKAAIIKAAMAGVAQEKYMRCECAWRRWLASMPRGRP